MAKKIASPNDSLQQSTREPSQRSAEITSLDTISFSSGKRFLSAGAQIGGGSYKLYMLEHLASMHADIEATTRKLELEQRRLAKLDKDLVGNEQEYETKRQRYKLSQSTQDDHLHHKEAENKQLEKRLIKAIADLNKGTSENEQLRQEIDRLRRERELLNSVFKNLERGIASNRRGMDRLKANMNEEKGLDEDANQRTKALGKLMDRERMQFQKDTEKLRVEVGELNEVERERERPRAPEQALQGPTTARGKNRRAYMVADEEEAFSEQSMHRRILKLSFLNTIQRRHIKQHQKNIEVFEQAFATIRSSTGISDIEEIVKIFVHLEQRNFSLLTYVNQLNQDIEYVEKRNRELKDQMESHKLDEQDSAARKETALNDVSMQIAKTKASTEEKTKMIKDAEGALDECRPLISNIVRYLRQEIPGLIRAAFEGDAPPMKTMAPDPTEDNLNHHLMYIEEAISQFKVCLSPDVKPPGVPAKAGASRPGHAEAKGGGPKVPNDLPSAHIGGDDSDDDPETGLGDRPFNKLELRERAQANIQRRRKKRGEGGARPAHEERGRSEAADEGAPPAAPAPAPVEAAARRDVGPPPPKDNTASSVTSKESGGDGGAAGSSGPSGGSAMPRSPAASAKAPAADATSSSPREAASQDEEANGGKAWWSGQGKEKRK